MPGIIINHGQQGVQYLIDNTSISLQWLIVLVGTSQLWNEKWGKVYVHEFMWMKKNTIVVLGQNKDPITIS